jgi:hypothetical protein
LRGRAGPGTVSCVERPVPSFTGVKVFSTTLARDREALSARITAWLKEHAELEIVDQVVTQSSDKEFHCLTFTLFYRERGG